MELGGGFAERFLKPSVWEVKTPQPVMIFNNLN